MAVWIRKTVESNIRQFDSGNWRCLTDQTALCNTTKSTELSGTTIKNQIDGTKIITYGKTCLEPNQRIKNGFLCLQNSKSELASAKGTYTYLCLKYKVQ